MKQESIDERLAARITGQFRESAELKVASAEALTPVISRAARLLAEALRAGGKVMACGNGGSAADAQHFAAELVNRFERERAPLAGLALTTDTSNLTAIANDYAYVEVFSKQLRALGRPGDVLIAITTSGNSANVLHAVGTARELGIRVIALSGNGGGKLCDALSAEDLHVCVPHPRTARIQEVHLLVLHCLCDAIDHLLLEETA